jgi:hypothetical protein
LLQSKVSVQKKESNKMSMTAGYYKWNRYPPRVRCI